MRALDELFVQIDAGIEDLSSDLCISSSAQNQGQCITAPAPDFFRDLSDPIGIPDVVEQRRP